MLPAKLKAGFLPRNSHEMTAEKPQKACKAEEIQLNLRGQFPFLKARLPALWSRSYYAGVCGRAVRSQDVELRRFGEVWRQRNF